MWFDSSSIANLAKNALKEAQKHIDNVLDIKEDEEADSTGNDPKLVKSKTMPSMQETAKNLQQDSVWGSFNGSFFENKPEQSPITNAPPRKSETSTESLEIISRTTSTLPSPDLHESSSQSTLHLSVDDSVEIINKTPSNLDISSAAEVLDSSLIHADSVEITEDDTSDLLMTPDEASSIPITIAPARNPQEIDTSTTILSISDNTLTNSETESFYDASKDELDQTLKVSLNFMDRSIESFEIQTQISDSTHSFEEIQHPSRPKLPLSPSDDAKNDEKKGGSGHTSGDELETATSSDIEIISSPNCDSSSTNSCNKVSPKAEFPYQNSESFLAELNLDRKGHSRELSEVSVLSLASDESPGTPAELEKMLKRVTELSEVLEQREYKMVQMGRTNAELVETNNRLTQELDGIKKNRNSLDMTNVQEEYTQRLSALEKKFQQSIRENSMLKKKSESMKAEMDSKVSREDHEKAISEKDFVIDALKTEGEKLSKQILQHSNIIKKLRAKLKENEEMLKRQENQISEFTEENQKFKKTLTAKDEIEKSQSEGINKLTTDKRKIDKENQHLKSQNDDLQQKLLAVQTSYEALKRELSDKSSEMVQNLEGEKEKACNESRQLTKELSDLRQKIRDLESAATSREQKLRQENIELKQKLEETEFRIEDQKQEASLASIPLIRQLESLQTTLNSRTMQWENQERSLLEKLDEAQNQLKTHSDGDKALKDQITHLNLKVSSCEEKLSQASRKVEQTAGQLQQKEIEFQLHENDYKLRIDQLVMEVASKSNDVEKQKSLVLQLEEKTRLDRNELEEEKRKVLYIQQQQTQPHHHERQDSHDNDLGNVSPVLSLGSVESLHSHPWNLDDTEPGANSTYGSQYGGMVVNSSASLMEGLQSVLKQRDGEVQQLQWEIHRLQTERNFLSNEMSNLTADLEKASDQLKENEEMKGKQSEMQIQYDALLEMFGQKAEEYEELKLDLVDLKSISQIQKTQINDLTQKLNDFKPT